MLCCVLSYTILFYSALHYSVVFYFILFSPFLLCFISFHFILFSSILFYSVQFCSIRFHSVLSNSILSYSDWGSIEHYHGSNPTRIHAGLAPNDAVTLLSILKRSSAKKVREYVHRSNNIIPVRVCFVQQSELSYSRSPQTD